jgi:hypothetical protein
MDDQAVTLLSARIDGLAGEVAGLRKAMEDWRRDLPCATHRADLAVVNQRLEGHDQKIRSQCESLSELQEQHAEERGARRRTSALAAGVGTIAGWVLSQLPAWLKGG